LAKKKRGKPKIVFAFVLPKNRVYNYGASNAKQRRLTASEETKVPCKLFFAGQNKSAYV
jgi:hypothetical protein